MLNTEKLMFYVDEHFRTQVSVDEQLAQRWSASYEGFKIVVVIPK